MQRYRTRSNTRVVTVTSGKGGVGKSSFAVNLSIALAKRGMRVLIIDCDFGLANVDVMLGTSSPYDLSHVLRNKVPLRDCVQEGQGGVKFISGGSGVSELLNMDGLQLQQILHILLQLEDLADMIVFDTGAGISDIILQLIRASNEAIVVTTPEPTAIMDAYALIKTLYQQADTVPVRLVVNRAETPREADATLQSFARVIKKYMHQDIDLMGYVLEDANASRSIKQQSPIVLSFPRSQAALNIETIASRYMAVPEDHSRKTGIAAFLERFLRKKQ